MTTSPYVRDVLADLGRAGVRLTRTSAGRLGCHIPADYPFRDDARDWLVLYRDEVLTILADLDTQLAEALAIVEAVELKACTPGVRSRAARLKFAAAYKKHLTEYRDCLSPLASGAVEWARMLAERTEPSHDQTRKDPPTCPITGATPTASAAPAPSP